MAAAALQLKRKAEEEEEEETERLGKQRERFPELSGLYKPTESLGQGTYAVVWRAHVLHGDAEGSEVAVKRFKTQHNKLSRLQNEAQMLIQCRCARTLRARAAATRETGTAAERARCDACTLRASSHARRPAARADRRDGTNVVALHKIVRKDEKVAFILPYFPHDSFRVRCARGVLRTPPTTTRPCPCPGRARVPPRATHRRVTCMRPVARIGRS